MPDIFTVFKMCGFLLILWKTPDCLIAASAHGFSSAVLTHQLLPSCTSSIQKANSRHILISLKSFNAPQMEQCPAEQPKGPLPSEHTPANELVRAGADNRHTMV